MESVPNNPTKSFTTTHGEEFLHQFPTTQNTSEQSQAKKSELFIEAQHNLVNEKMFGLFVRAITEKETSGSNETLSFLQNHIIQECVNLKESDTSLILDQFNRLVREWFLKKYGPSEIDSRVYQSISSGHYTTNPRHNIDAKGIQSVISFLKTRAKFLDTMPAQNYSFYFSDKLDARYSIDVIEEIGDVNEPIISLFQIKSSPPSKEETERIHQDHKLWVSEKWIDLEKYDKSYVSEGTDEEVSQFLKNKEKVEESLLEFCTNPGGQDLPHLLVSLHFENLSHRQQAWVFWKYIDLLKEQLDAAVADGALDQETYILVWRELSAFREKLNKKAHLPRSQTLIKKVRSVISVGARSISEREIEVGGSGKVMNIR